ncbi:beta-galactosidase [Mobilitalea sibirica]|uniref:beta-galactosidase n=1 Tax=Mobilitalea sibirica TaxID=1462919 RepID=A0A8J7GWZ2_9FIRM|nr:beta-galactosidase [Mobilitalea sibirica]MBH1939489.1 beta-galactosidase [Mobilitalea sibirica]
MVNKNENEKSVEFGAVYYRRSNPPRQDWERDYEQAAKDGMTIFRHWFLWSAIEIAPGVYNWEPYDRQLELAAKYGIKTVIAEMSDYAPEWFCAKYPEAIREDYKGKKRFNDIGSSCVTGGTFMMCMDHPEVQKGVKSFLTALGERYQDHPAVYGYDVWNECSLYTPELLCYCPSTQIRFREWLKGRYDNLDELNQAWFRYSYTDWNQVQLPRVVGNYPEVMDSIKFHNENQLYWFRIKSEVLRNADPNHKVFAHGNAKSHKDIATCCGDDWAYPNYADLYGYTHWYSNQCRSLMSGDMTRLACDGKEFWRAEAIGDSTWDGRSDKTDYESDKDLMSIPENIRYDAMSTFVTGSKVFMNPRWRPLCEGGLFHAYGWYAPDGSPTERSEMVASIESWCNAPEQTDLWKANPVKGECAILLLEDSQALCYSLYKDTDIYAKCLTGAYNAFTDASIQADIIRLHQLNHYDMVYVPYPLAISDQDMDRISEWVHNGGTLISEGCFGYFNDRGHGMEQQPNRNFKEKFGYRQSKVHLGPDKHKELIIQTNKGPIHGGVYRQEFEVIGQSTCVTGTYPDGKNAVVCDTYGKGRIMMVGSMPGYGYYLNEDTETRNWFQSLLTFGGKRQRLRINGNPGVIGRVWEDHNKNIYLWVLNSTEYDREVEVELLEDRVIPESCLRGTGLKILSDQRLLITVQNRDAAVISVKVK